MKKPTSTARPRETQASPAAIPSSGGSSVRAYLQLIRAPNVFTALADVMMGYLFTHPGASPLRPAGQFAALAVASCLLYMAGMVLNDLFDLRVDAAERPGRPIPSGRVSLATARGLGWGLLVAGVATAWGASFFFGGWRAGLVGSALAVCVVAYDAILKRTPLGPLAMGGCRFFNVLLGMSLAVAGDGTSAPWTAANWLVAAGVGVYIVGVTWFARREAALSGRVPLAAATVVMFVGVGLLAWLPDWDNRVGLPPQRWFLFWAIIGALIGWRCVRAIATPSPAFVQSAVKQCILSLIVLDAAVVAAVHTPMWGVMVLLLVVPAMFLGRWIYST
jgi:4-hydroxybenzoate polyprenyltransferase